MTEFQIKFKNAMLKVTDDIQFINAKYLFARTDEVRQEIIDGINNGTVTTKDDVTAITRKMSPCYHLLNKN